MIFERSQRLILFDAYKLPYFFQITPTLSEVFNLEFPIF